MKIAVAVTGASGAVYARLLVERLAKTEEVEELALIFTDNGKQVMEYEEGMEWLQEFSFIRYFDNRDFNAPVASGSGDYDALVLVPCSAGMMGRIANGISDDLVSRAADVMLKERRLLILVLRETPLTSIHIDNMKAITVAGGIVMPAAPFFYSRPSSIEELCGTVIQRIISLLKLSSGQDFHWGGPDKFFK